MSKKVTQIIENQFKAWSHQNRSDRKSSQKEHFPVITVSREFGALGAALADILGEQLGFKVWDKELLQAISEELGSDEKFLENVDERRRNPIEDAVLGFMKNKNTNTNYLLALIRVVNTIEEFGSSIIVGRGASYICQDDSSFHVRVVSPLKKRITGYASREQISKEQAHETIREKDAERADFVQFNFNKDVTTPSDYDLVLNSGNYELEELANIAVKAFEIKTGQPVTAENS